MRRLTGILLVCVFLALGSGAISWLHNLAHDREDAMALGQASNDETPPPTRSHDENNCDLHALLCAPITAPIWVPLLVLLGLFVAFLTQLTSPLVSQRALIRIDCRGPPVC